MKQVTPLSFPTVTAPPTEPTVIVEVPARYIPLAIMGLEGYKLRFRWESDADYEAGYQGVCLFQEGLLMGIGTELVQAIDRVYMAVRQGTVGEVFTAGPGDTPPALPVVPPPLPAEATGGILGQMYAARGIINAGIFGIGGQPATLAALFEAVRAGSPAEVERVTDVLDALSGAGSAATIFNAVREFFADGASVSAEGLMLTTMVASAMANAAMMGLQGAQLDALQTELAAISAKLAAAVPATADETVAGEIAQVVELLTPEA
jgi:hypothetical protein